MHLDDYNCELCLFQREETITHLFLRCPFAKSCWNIIGINAPHTDYPLVVVQRIRRQLRVPFYMEIIILMIWSIWTVRNNWIFNNQDPSLQACRAKFIYEFTMVIHRAKSNLKNEMSSWIHNFQLPSSRLSFYFPLFLILVL